MVSADGSLHSEQSCRPGLLSVLMAMELSVLVAGFTGAETEQSGSCSDEWRGVI